MSDKKNSLLRIKFFWAALFITLAGVFWFIRSYNQSRLHSEKQVRFMMDTYVTIYAGGLQEKASKAISMALDRMQEIDIKMNYLNPKSQLYAFNEYGRPIDDPEIINVVSAALDISRKSGGAFDITILPLVEAWGFNTERPHIPKDEELKHALKRVGYQHLAISEGKLIKDMPEVAIDLGGIAKGYAVGEAEKVLKAQGISSAMIDAGGDVYMIGKQGNRDWKVGIKDPRQEGLLGYMELRDVSVATSGDYQRFFMEKGRRYHHIFNPKTGYPSEGLQSVTVIYPDCTLTDAWTTALFVMGAEKGMEMVKKLPGMEVVMVTASGKILLSPNLEGTLKSVSQ